MTKPIINADQHPKAVEYIGMAKLAIASFKAREPKTDNTVIVGDSRQLPPSTDKNGVSIDAVEDAEGGLCVRLRMPGYSDMLFQCSSAVEYKAALANANAELQRRLKMKG